MPNKLAIIGAGGSVGAAIAYAAVLKKVASQVLMVDIDEEKCLSQVMDIADAAFLSNVTVKKASFQEAGQAQVIIISAGAKQKPGETRIELLERNFKILTSCINAMKPLNPNACLVLVSNPVDIVTFFAQEISGLSKNQVFGTGTFLDSARLRAELGLLLDICENAIHAYVLGEHGDSQFVAWSSATVANKPLLSMPEMATVNRTQLAESVKNKAYKIIEAKGSTYFGIGGCAASICESIFTNSKQVRPVSHWVPELNVCISIPAVIGEKGIQKTLMPPLNPEEQAALHHSAQRLREQIEKYVPH